MIPILVYLHIFLHIAFQLILLLVAFQYFQIILMSLFLLVFYSLFLLILQLYTYILHSDIFQNPHSFHLVKIKSSVFLFVALLQQTLNTLVYQYLNIDLLIHLAYISHCLDLKDMQQFQYQI